MIVQCPSCSTGFNLPDKHITPKGAKLRCSKCNHVFRVRRVDDVQELQFFYKPEDEQANMDSGTHLQSRTQIGLATSESIPISTPSGSFSLGSQEIPMADEGNSTSFGFGQRVMEATARIQAPPSPPPAPTPFGNQTTPDDLNPFVLAQDNPETIDLFEGEADPFADVFKGLESGGKGLKDSFSDFSQVSEADPAQSEEILKPSQPRPPGRPAVHDHADQGPAPTSPGNPLMEKTASDDIWEQGGQLSSVMVQADDLVDESFGQSGPVFDAAQGIVEAKEANIMPRQPARHPGRASQQTFADTPSAKQGGAGTPEKGPRPTPAPQAADPWAVSQDEGPLGSVGKSGAQKLVNTLFIAGLLGLGFVAFVASQNQMHLDFLHFGDMVKHAFGSGTYTPRDQWAKAQSLPAAPQPPPQELLRPENVWAESISLDNENILVIRGTMRNFGPQEFLDVKVRAVVLNTKGKILQEQEAPLGALLAHDALRNAPDLPAARALLPKRALALAPGGTQPFTVVLQAPESPTSGLLYRVDVAKKVSTDDL